MSDFIYSFFSMCHDKKSLPICLIFLPFHIFSSIIVRMVSISVNSVLTDLKVSVLCYCIFQIKFIYLFFAGFVLACLLNYWCCFPFENKYTMTNQCPSQGEEVKDKITEWLHKLICQHKYWPRKSFQS